MYEWGEYIRICNLVFCAICFLHFIGLLNLDSEEHLLAFQEVFIPCISQTLSEYVDQWNSHPVSIVLGIRPQSKCLVMVQ